MAVEGGRWRDRRSLAWLLRLGIVATPVLVAVVVVRTADAVFTPRHWAVWQELLLMTPLALGAGLVAERALRRLLPLAMLLRMDLLFPGRAPSRFVVARQSRSRDQLMQMLADRDAGPQQAARAMMTLLAALAGHDRRTRGHSERTRVLADVLGTELKLSQYDRDRLRWAALLHDIGKLEIAPRLLNKPTALSESEWQRVRLHPVHGANLTSALAGWLGPWAEGILHHHERYDGTGYPGGLAGEQISLAGRVIAVVDAYESMTASRPYQKARATRAAREELVRCAGSDFDPAVVRAFLSISMPRLLWATGPVALLTHLPYLRELQLVGQQLTTVAGSQVATAAGVTAMVVSASAVPAWSSADQAPAAPAQVSSSAGTRVPDRPLGQGETDAPAPSGAAGGAGAAATGADPDAVPADSGAAASGSAGAGRRGASGGSPRLDETAQEAGAGAAADGPEQAGTDEQEQVGADASGAQAAGEKRTADDTAADKKAADSKAADSKAADSKAANSKAANKKAADKKAADKKAADKKAADSKAADEKAADSKAGDGGRGKQGGRG